MLFALALHCAERCNVQQRGMQRATTRDATCNNKECIVQQRGCNVQHRGMQRATLRDARATTRNAAGNNAGCNSLSIVAQHGERATDSVAFDRFDVLPLLGTLLADADAIARHAHKALQGYINAAIAARYLDTTRHAMNRRSRAVGPTVLAIGGPACLRLRCILHLVA